MQVGCVKRGNRGLVGQVGAPNMKDLVPAMVKHD
jgi:hypothetical protein